MIDLIKPKSMEILVRDDYKVIWINVDGACVCRVYDPKQLSITMPDFNHETRDPFDNRE